MQQNEKKEPLKIVLLHAHAHARQRWRQKQERSLHCDGENERK